MAILSWGKPKIQHKESVNGASVAGGTWTDIDTPKQDTTKVTPTAGNEVTANEEGGEVVDSRVGKNTYQFEFDIFVKKGQPRPFEDEDGFIKGEHAFRVIPEDDACEGMQIDRCTLRVEESYTAADGKMLHYVAKCLKPAAGKTVKPYTDNGLTVDKTSLIKQADVVMLMYLLENEFSAEEIKENYHYYEKRTLHGSSLSPAIYSIVGLRTGDKGKAYRYLRRAAFIDLHNLQKNTREGIHAANAGGVWQVIVFGFAGVKTDDKGELIIAPNMPEGWNSLSFKLWHNGKRLSINIYDDNSYRIEEI